MYHLIVTKMVKLTDEEKKAIREERQRRNYQSQYDSVMENYETVQVLDVMLDDAEYTAIKKAAIGIKV